MKYSVLSLDFWQNTAIYMGKSYPCGTIGCDALNISPGIINHSLQYAVRIHGASHDRLWESHVAPGSQRGGNADYQVAEKCEALFVCGFAGC